MGGSNGFSWASDLNVVNRRFKDLFGGRGVGESSARAECYPALGRLIVFSCESNSCACLASLDILE